MVHKGLELTLAQNQELLELDLVLRCVFQRSSVPYQDTPGVLIRQQPYRVLETSCHAIEAEVVQMLWDGAIEESSSPWSSPIVMVQAQRGLVV